MTIFWVAVLASVLASISPLSAQSTPKGLRRSLDAFTGDTVVAIDYGRLEEREGCGRSDIAIILTRHSGARGTYDFLTYQWHKIDDPFAGRVYYLNAMSAFLNIANTILRPERAMRIAAFRSGDVTRRCRNWSWILDAPTLWSTLGNHFTPLSHKGLVTDVVNRQESGSHLH